ncbi:hypothetical protein NJI34_33520 [Pseudomonas sp. S 311-6]|uniref:DUF6708 domain-containing protein n=1 Tax=Pseudomonas TaxID=286 RepID=UPI00209824A8|nr:MULTISPECIES: DUF6708 domain-containing protein [Pseudomonas]MCO7567127.1 hypothetical protein [Pseudomonas mosselii]MCO7618420.1 hypothetical protein [Pseudomonas guariconensis]MCO7641688.1 hypothetical protein [Pseudomonas sp. S 311-6]
MSVIWLFAPKCKTETKPRVSSQISSTTNETLTLRNPWVTDSVFMGKLYTAMTVGLALLTYPKIFIPDTFDRAYLLMIMQFLAPLIFSPFLAYRILYIKKLSNIYLNRSTKKVYYKRFKSLFIFDWNNMRGGLFKRTEFGGASFSTSYALAFAPRRADGTLHQKDCLWVDSNEPTEPDIKYVAEVWEYLRHFMDHGPDKLPPPGEPNWWYKPLHQICLTPAEAWQHYAPWRTGEPGEMQGKKNWQLPFWAVLFPYNLSVALCWYAICRLFNVRAAPPPPEAFEEDR